ncbi:MAG: DUF5072 family protein [Ruminococcus sp.]|nr:DUF5072 family protein [Ruminococcus sp.]
MNKQLGWSVLIAAIQKKIQDNTGLACLSVMPANAEGPFYFTEVVGKRPAHSKTMYKDVFTVWIHTIAEPPEKEGESSVPIYELIQKLEEALTEDIELPEDVELIRQTNLGIPAIKAEETSDTHTVLAYEFMVCYGLQCKV